jgi:hypothetical protein
MGKIQLYLSLLLLLSVNLPLRSPSRPTPLLEAKIGLMGRNLSMPSMWMGTGIWMCSPLLRMMIKSPGTKTTASSTSPAIPLQQMRVVHHPSMPPMWMETGI